MNLRITWKALLLTWSASLILYGLHDYINAAMGLKESILNSAWQLLALSTGLSIVSGVAYPHARGIKRGDQLIAFVKRNVQQGNEITEVGMPVFAMALESGRKGEKIRVELHGFTDRVQVGEGVIESYAGIISPPTLRLLERES